MGLGDEGRANTRETQDPPSKNEDGAPGGETQEPARCRRYKGEGESGIGRVLAWNVGRQVRDIGCELAHDKFLKEIDGGSFANAD